MNDVNQPKHILDFLEFYSQNPYGFLLLYGKNGTGKSYAAMSIYKKISPFTLPQYDHDIAIFISQADLNLKWSEENKNGDMTYFFDKYSKTKLLVLDDLGTRIPTEAFMDWIYNLIDYRSVNREELGTIITTNLGIEDITKHFGNAVMSRLRSGKIFKMDGKDRRANTLNSDLNTSNLTNKKQNQSSEVQLAIY